MPIGWETSKSPIRSALLEQRTGGLVARWVAASGYPLMYDYTVNFRYNEHRYTDIHGVACMDANLH